MNGVTALFYITVVKFGSKPIVSTNVLNCPTRWFQVFRRATVMAKFVAKPVSRQRIRDSLIGRCRRRTGFELLNEDAQGLGAIVPTVAHRNASGPLPPRVGPVG